MQSDDRSTLVTNIGPLTAAFKANHFGLRLCQLFCFLPLFLLSLALFNFALDIVAWAGESLSALITETPTPAMVSLEAFEDLLDLENFVTLLVTAIMFVALSNMKRALWALPFGLLAIGISFAREVQTAFTQEYDWVSQSGPDMAIAQGLVPYLYVPVLIALHALFAWIFVKAAITSAAVSDDDRASLSEFRRGKGSLFAPLRSLINIPQANRYAKRRGWTGFLMVIAGLANFMNFWRAVTVVVFVILIPVLAVEQFPKIGVVIRALFEGRSLDRVALDLTVVGVVLAFYLACIMVLPWAIKRLCQLCVRKSEEQMRTSLERVQHLDERAPILFLRSFVNDKVPLPKGRWTITRWLLDDAGSMDTLDHMILEEGTRTGPTVALGNPDDPAPPYGVARGYFEHDSWKQAVEGLCERSVAIVMVLDETEGVEWEIGHIAARRYTQKTLFLLAPEDVGTPRGHSLLGGALARATRTDKDARTREIAQAKAAPILGFRMIGGEVELICAVAAEKYDYLVALRRFLRDLTPREAATQAVPLRPATA